MSRLSPCLACARHVRDAETACPFCGAAFTPGPAPTRVVSERVRRAVLLTLGPVVLVGAAATLDGCSNTATYGTPDANVHYDAQPGDAGTDGGQ